MASAGSVKTSLKDTVREIAKKGLKGPDEFKAWRVNNNLAENLEMASELQLSQIWTVLREIKEIK